MRKFKFKSFVAAFAVITTVSIAAYSNPARVFANPRTTNNPTRTTYLGPNGYIDRSFIIGPGGIIDNSQHYNNIDIQSVRNAETRQPN